MLKDFGKISFIIGGLNAVLVILLSSLIIFHISQTVFSSHNESVLAAPVVSHPSPGFVTPVVLGTSTVHAQTCVDFYSLNVLVNKENSISTDFAPNDLVNLADWNIPAVPGIQLRAEAARHLQTLLLAMKDLGLSFFVNSGFRTYDFQKQLYQQGGPEEGGLSIPAPAGASEHELGTAVDLALGNGGRIYPSASWTWLDQNAHRFGFVMSYRYSQQKETGIYFEPWHFRYVGIDLASEIRHSANTPQSFYQKPGCY